jgi:hypothetical protein
MKKIAASEAPNLEKFVCKSQLYQNLLKMQNNHEIFTFYNILLKIEEQQLKILEK